MVASRWWTPRLVMHPWVPSTTTATPWGRSTRSNVLAISAVISGGTQHGYAQGRSVGEEPVEDLASLVRPPGLRRAPANGDDVDPVGPIMQGLGNSIDEATVSAAIDREIRTAYLQLAFVCLFVLLGALLAAEPKPDPASPHPDAPPSF